MENSNINCEDIYERFEIELNYKIKKDFNKYDLVLKNKQPIKWLFHKINVYSFEKWLDIRNFEVKTWASSISFNPKEIIIIIELFSYWVKIARLENEYTY